MRCDVMWCKYVCMSVCMYVWMDGWMDGRTDGWMDVCMCVCMCVCVYVCVYIIIYTRTFNCSTVLGSWNLRCVSTNFWATLYFRTSAPKRCEFVFLPFPQPNPPGHPEKCNWGISVRFSRKSRISQELNLRYKMIQVWIVHIVHECQLRSQVQVPLYDFPACLSAYVFPRTKGTNKAMNSTTWSQHVFCLNYIEEPGKNTPATKNRCWSCLIWM